MTLVLTIADATRRPDHGDTGRMLDHGSLIIGRGGEADWILPDPNRQISKLHCRIDAAEMGWKLTDLSTNGTLFGIAREALGKNNSVVLRDGDRFQVGDYAIEVMITEADAAVSAPSAEPTPAEGGFDPFGITAPPEIPPEDRSIIPSMDFGSTPAWDGPNSPSEPSFGDGDPFDGFFGDAGDPPAAGPDPFSFGDFDPFGSSGGSWLDEPSGQDRAALEDHGALLSEAFVAPDTPDLIPTNWDPLEEPATLEAQDSDPFAESDSDPFTASNPDPFADPLDDPFADAIPEDPLADLLAPRAEEPVAPPPQPPHPPLSHPDPAEASASPDSVGPVEDVQPEPVAAVDDPSPAAPSLGFESSTRAFTAPDFDPEPSSPRETTQAFGGESGDSVSADDLIGAFLEAAGLTDAEIKPEERIDIMRRAGAVLKESVGGLRGLLSGRAQVRSSLDIEQTAFAGRNNNAIKIADSDEDALKLLILLDTPAFMPGPLAVSEAANDIKIHQRAITASVGGAVDTVLSRFDPTTLEAALEKEGLLGGILGGNRKAKLWELFCDRYNDIAAEAGDDFLVQFSSAVARAYQEEISK